MPQTRLKPEVLVFDVNETLLDLSAMQPLFQQTFGDSTALRDWFGLLLQYSLVTTITEHYYDFAALGKATLRMLAEARNVKLPVGGEGQVIQSLKSCKGKWLCFDAAYVLSFRRYLQSKWWN